MKQSTLYHNVSKALEQLKQGKMIILTDDQSRENEGDLVCAAQSITAEQINFMAHFGCGLICTPLSAAIIDQFGLPMMTYNNSSTYGTAFTVSVGAKQGVTTGISAADRAHTVSVLMDGDASSADIVMPGHVFPLRAHPGGVIARAGHTEGSVDLMTLAGLKPGAVICEIMDETGVMAKGASLASFAEKHKLHTVSVEEVAAFRSATECLVSEVATTTLPIKDLGEFTIKVFKDDIDQGEHVAIIKGELNGQEPVLTRLHSECLTGDIFSSLRCDCGQQLDAALKAIDAEGGVLLYLPQEGRGIGLTNKIKAYQLQDQGMDTVEANQFLGFTADERHYRVGAHILRYLGVEKINLMTNNPKKMAELERLNIQVNKRIPIQVSVSKHNEKYLQTKREKLGHFLDIKEEGK